MEDWRELVSNPAIKFSDFSLMQKNLSDISHLDVRRSVAVSERWKLEKMWQ
jgi:hypothetical protein